MKNGTRFIGIVKDNFKQGHGKIIFPSGSYYEGNFD